MLLFLSRKIADDIEAHHETCEVDIAPFAVFLNQDEKTYVEPDLSVIYDKEKLMEKGCNGAPDWIIEIVSLSSRQMDYYKKLFQYRTAGVKEYQIVDYEKDWILVYNFKNNTIEDYTCSDKVKVGMYPDFEIDFSEISGKE